MYIAFYIFLVIYFTAVFYEAYVIKRKHQTGYDVKDSAILNLSEENRLKRADKLWKKLVKELDVLQDDSYTARKLFDI